MALPELTPQLVLLEEAVTILFCRVDDVTECLEVWNSPRLNRSA